MLLVRCTPSRALPARQRGAACIILVAIHPGPVSPFHSLASSRQVQSLIPIWARSRSFARSLAPLCWSCSSIPVVCDPNLRRHPPNSLPDRAPAAHHRPVPRFPDRLLTTTAATAL